MLNFGAEIRFVWTSFRFALLKVVVGVMTKKEMKSSFLPISFQKLDLSSSLKCLSFKLCESHTLNPALYVWCC